MDGNFILRTGKHAGKTIEWLRDNEPMYLVWIEENRPEMLKEVKAKPVVKMNKMESNPNTMVPNMNFWNEGPDLQSVIYKNKQKEQVKPSEQEDEWNF